MKPLTSYCTNASDFLAFCQLESLIFKPQNYPGHWRELAAICLVYSSEQEWFDHYPEYIEPFDCLSATGRLDLATALIERIREAQKCQA